MSVLSREGRVSQIGAFLGYIGAAVSFTAYTTYAVFLLQGRTDTNVITWGLWAVESILSFHIYRRQVKGDLPKYLEELVAAIGCCTVTAVLFGRATLAGVDILKQLHWVDGISVILFLIVLYIYKTTKDVWNATLAFQGVVIFSSLPLVRSVFENPTAEPLLPWILWTLGFLFQLLCVIARSGGLASYRTFPTPMNYLFWHGFVAIIVFSSYGHLPK